MTNIERIKERLKQEMPGAEEGYIDKVALKLINTHPLIREAVDMWAETGDFKDVEIGEFSIRELMSFKSIEGSFKDAALYLDRHSRGETLDFLLYE